MCTHYENSRCSPIPRRSRSADTQVVDKDTRRRRHRCKGEALSDEININLQIFNCKWTHVNLAF